MTESVKVTITLITDDSEVTIELLHREPEDDVGEEWKSIGTELGYCLAFAVQALDGQMPSCVQGYREMREAFVDIIDEYIATNTHE